MLSNAMIKLKVGSVWMILRYISRGSNSFGCSGVLQHSILRLEGKKLQVMNCLNYFSRQNELLPDLQERIFCCMQRLMGEGLSPSFPTPFNLTRQRGWGAIAKLRAFHHL